MGKLIHHKDISVVHKMKYTFVCRILILLFNISLVLSCSRDLQASCKIDYQICTNGLFVNQTCNCFESLLFCFNDSKCINNETSTLLNKECIKFSCRTNCTFRENDNSDKFAIGAFIGFGSIVGLVILIAVGMGIFLVITETVTGDKITQFFRRVFSRNSAEEGDEELDVGSPVD